MTDVTDVMTICVENVMICVTVTEGLPHSTLAEYT